MYHVAGIFFQEHMPIIGKCMYTSVPGHIFAYSDFIREIITLETFIYPSSHHPSFYLSIYLFCLSLCIYMIFIDICLLGYRMEKLVVLPLTWMAIIIPVSGPQLYI